MQIRIAGHGPAPGRESFMSRTRIRSALTGLLIALALIVVLPTGAAAADPAPLRSWAFGWDPADYNLGLTVRHRLTPRWDLSVAAGPRDYREEIESRNWDSDNEVIDDGAVENEDHRREQGWVRMVAGGRFWQDGRLAVSGVGGVTYTWSVEDRRFRDYRNYSGALWDYRNTRESYDHSTWAFTLGIRPSFQVTNRMQIEAEAGLSFVRRTTDFESETWWDTFPATERHEETRHYRDFTSYGGVELYMLKLIFWF